MTNDFCHLHCHNEYSLLDGVGKAEEFAERAKQLGHRYLALTNHGNVDGLVRFQAACAKHDIVPLYGFEGYLVKNPADKVKYEKRGHITLIVKNDEGFRNLLKLLTLASTEGFHGRPRFSPEQLLRHSNGLVFMTACSSSFISFSWGMELFHDLCKKHPGDVYLEVMPLSFGPQYDINNLCLSLHEETGVKLVATNDCHYAKEGGDKVQEVLLAIQSNAKWKDPNRWRFEVGGLYMKSANYMRKGFAEQGVLYSSEVEEALRNTIEVAEKCSEFKLEKRPVNLPVLEQFEGKDPETVMRNICEKGMKQKVYGRIPKAGIKEYEDRYNYEIDLIAKLGFCLYFLIIWEIVDWCNKNDIMVGPGRGSVGGSLVAFLMGLTKVDPIKYGLLFARFISEARIDLPDVDTDFEDTKRGQIRQHLEELYGKHNVAGVSTFSTLRGRAALRDVARVFDVPQVEVNAASKSIVVRSVGDFRSDFSIEDAFNTFEDGIRFKKKYPDVTKYAIELEGQARGLGTHAAAIVVAREDIREGHNAHFRYGKGNELIVNWDKIDLEHMGLMKLDILGLNALTILNESRKMVHRNTKKWIEYDDLPLDDEKVLSEFTRGNCVGVFQFGSLGLMRLCGEVGIDDFMILCHTNALYRPGTLRSGMTTEFCQRKNGQKKFSFKHPLMKKLTEETYGIILYQEQVMAFMYDMAGLPWRTADYVRKVMSKGQGIEQFLSYKEQFAKGCEERGTLDRKTAEELWAELANFGSYGFNKSHSVEYSLIAYWDMYMKVYHPIEFIACSLTYGNELKKEELIDEAARLGIKINLPKIGYSKASEWVVHKGSLYMPFSEIRGVGPKFAVALEEKIEGKGGKAFMRKDGKALSQKVIDAIGFIDKHQDDIEALQPYFDIELDRDKHKRYEKMITAIASSIDMTLLSGENFDKPNKAPRYYLGQMTEIKFGYRAKVTGLSTEDRMRAEGMAGALGGVYGNFKDSSDYRMLVFGPAIYQEKKDAVEHCTGNFIIAKCSHPWRNGNLACEYAWIGNEIETASFDGLGLNVIRRSNGFRDREVQACTSCSLRSECRHPVRSSSGVVNVMLCGEAPGRDEDLEGRGFVGRAGDLLWNSFKPYGLVRNLFHITNVVKCWPQYTRTPTKEHIAACSKWLDIEIANVQPILVLAFGNTSLKYFKGKDTGIMELNGRTEWDYKLGAWVSWCIHPASVLHHPENRELFKNGIDNFCRTYKNLGGVTSEREREKPNRYARDRQVQP